MSEQELTAQHAAIIYERHGATGDPDIRVAAVILRLERERDRADERTQYERERAKEADERAERERAGAAVLRRALDEIDHHTVGAYETDSGSVEPCDECGEMRTIAENALTVTDAGAALLVALAKAQASASRYRGTISSARILLWGRPVKTAFDDDVIRMLDHTLAEREAGAALLSAIQGVLGAWERLGRCQDEFLPDQPEACGEYVDLLDSAIVELQRVLGWPDSTLRN